jgi:ATP-dependent DNA helicase PIF1
MIAKSTMIEKVVVPALTESKRRFVLTAPTGLAAIQIHGQTIHSWGGLGYIDQTSASIVHWLKSNDSAALTRWLSVDTVVIDEISLISGPLFDQIDHIARAIRGRKDEPFGGIQMILCGDFLQLPPVKKEPFAFQAYAWNFITHQVRLVNAYRQMPQSLTEARFVT